MSWDVWLFWLASDPAEFPHELRTRSLGEARFLRARLQRQLPSLEWSGARGLLLRGAGSVDVRLCRGSEAVESGEVDRIDLAFRGEPDPFEVLGLLCRDTGWTACDCSTMTLLDPEDPTSRGWESFRDARSSLPSRGRGSQRAGGSRRPRKPFRWWKGIFRFDGPPRLSAQMVFEGLPMGDARDVRERIGAAFPGITWTESKGTVVLEECAFEFLVPEEGVVRQVDFYVTCGRTDDYQSEAAPHVARLTEAAGWTVVDWS